MANTRSAKKRVRSQARKYSRNRIIRSAVKTAIGRARKEIGDSAELGQAWEAVSLLDRAAGKGVLHPNNAARRKARLMRLMHRQGTGADAGPTEKPVAKVAAEPATPKTRKERKPKG